MSIFGESVSVNENQYDFQGNKFFKETEFKWNQSSTKFINSPGKSKKTEAWQYRSKSIKEHNCHFVLQKSYRGTPSPSPGRRSCASGASRQSCQWSVSGVLDFAPFPNTTWNLPPLKITKNCLNLPSILMGWSTVRIFDWSKEGHWQMSTNFFPLFPHIAHISVFASQVSLLGFPVIPLFLPPL